MVAYTVDKTADEMDGIYTAGQLSLREAINIASSGDTIQFAAGLSGQTIFLTLGELALTQDVTIDGDSNGDNKADITISGNNSSRIFNITGATTDVDLLSLTLQDGNASGGGGAIFSDNIATLDITDTTIANNTAVSYGGGIRSRGTDATLINVLLTGNHSIQRGGGGHFSSSGTVILTNTTVDGNSSNNLGGGLFLATSSSSSVLFNNSTVTNNLADANGTDTSSGGGLFFFYNDNSIILNSVIADNTTGGALATPADDDVRGTVATAKYSFFGTTETITSNYASINGGGDPLLATLTDNGGTVQTRNILSGSALINAGGNNVIAAGLTTDANGNARIVAGTVDIGATEFELVVTSSLDEAEGATLADDIADGAGLSLREAIAHASAGNTITFDSTLAGGTIVLTRGQLGLYQDLIIDGDSNGDNIPDITIDADNASRIFEIGGSTTDVDLLSLTITNGMAAVFGGAIFANGANSLDILNTTISNSHSAAHSGGGITNLGTTTSLTNVLLTGNSTNGIGGGVNFGAASTATLINVTVYGNSSNSTGGGIFVGSNSSVSLYNSTVTGNLADADGMSNTAGGGISNNNFLQLFNSVIAENTSGGLFPSAPNDDVNGAISVAGNSFIGTSETISFDFGGNTNGGGDPILGELLNNGGSTLTRSPLDASPLIGAGNVASLLPDIFDLDGDGNVAEPLPLDGRGGLRIIGASVDIGAVEQFKNETIIGTDGANTIVGGNGDDVLTGLAGGDNIDGGAHDAIGDTASFAGSSGAVQINLDAGTATGGHAAGDVLLNIENLIGSSFGDILTGTNVANLIDGALGNDTLNGLGGNDVLIGGFNQDTLNGGDGDDDLEGKEGNDIIDGGAGTDTGRFDSFGGAVIINLNLTSAQNTGAAGTDTITNVENLIGGIGNDRFTGKTGVSVLEGGGGSDSLFGLGGDDILNGGDGNDNAQGGNGADMLIGGDGRDTLVGGGGIDTIQGDDGKDVIRGGDDGDIIDGGAGRDVLIGGDFTGGGFPGDGAADTFVFTDVSHSAFGGATRDIIRDFEQTLDVIDLSAIDAIIGGGDNAFTFIGTSDFSGAAGELRAFSIGGNTTVRADVNGGGTADLEIFLNGTIAMTAGDFVL